MRDMKTRLLLFFQKLNQVDLNRVIQSKVEEANQPEVSVSCEVFKVQLITTPSQLVVESRGKG
jgi:hypothetical protein